MIAGDFSAPPPGAVGIGQQRFRFAPIAPGAAPIAFGYGCAPPLPPGPVGSTFHSFLHRKQARSWRPVGDTDGRLRPAGYPPADSSCNSVPAPASFFRPPSPPEPASPPRLVASRNSLCFVAQSPGTAR